MLQWLPQEEDKREDLLLKIQELRDNPAFLAVQYRMTTLQQLSQRELESEIQMPRLHQLQGEVAAYRKSLSALDFLEQELKQKA